MDNNKEELEYQKNEYPYTKEELKRQEDSLLEELGNFHYDGPYDETLETYYADLQKELDAVRYELERLEARDRERDDR